MEMCSRLYYYLQNNCAKQGIKLAIAVQNGFRLQDNFIEFLKLAGIAEESIIYIDEPTKFKKIIVPEVSTIIAEYYTKEYLVPFKQIFDQIEPSNVKKIYFSRSKWTTELREKGNPCETFGEDKIEKAFKLNGFEICYPEEQSLAKLVSLLKGAEYVAGLTGTLTHNFIFCKPSTKIAILNREEYINPSQEMIRQACNHDVSYVDCFYNFLPTHPGFGPYVVGVTGNLGNYFKANHMKPTKVQNNITKDQAYQFLSEWIKVYTKNKHKDLIVYERSMKSILNLMANQFGEKEKLRELNINTGMIKTCGRDVANLTKDSSYGR